MMKFLSVPLVNLSIRSEHNVPPEGSASPTCRGILQPLFWALFFYRSHQLRSTPPFCGLRSCSLSSEAVRLFNVSCCYPQIPTLAILQKHAHMCLCMCVKPPRQLLIVLHYILPCQACFIIPSLPWTCCTLILSVIALATISSLPSPSH
jgi:hypothetical protein